MFALDDMVKVVATTNICKNEQHIFYGKIDSFDRDDFDYMTIGIYSIDKEPDFTKPCLGRAEFNTRVDKISLLK